MKLRNVFIFILFIGSNSAFSQTKATIKARENYAKGKYPEARGNCIKGLEDDKSETELWYIKAISEFEMYQMPKHRKGDVDYFKECMKSAVKAKNYDSEGRWYKIYGDRFLPLVAANNKEAISNFGQGRYPRALQTYKSSYELTGDTVALGMAGHCYYLMNQYLDASKTLSKVANMNFAANVKGNSSKTYVREAFEDLTAYYLDERKLYDSALIYCEMGLEVFPLNLKLLAWERQMLNLDMAKIRSNNGYCEEYNQLIYKSLHYFPSDTFYLHEQNNYYLGQIGLLAQNKEWADAELDYKDWFERKSELIGNKAKNPTDPFLTKDSATFIAKALEYFLSINAKGATLFFFYKWYPMQFKTEAIDEKRLEALLNNPPAGISHRLISMLMDHASEKYPKNVTIKKHRLTIYNAWLKQPISYYDWTNIIAMSDTIIKDFPKNLSLKPQQQKLLARSIDSLAKYGHTDLAWGYYYRLNNDNPKFEGLSKIQLKIAKADFEKRFKGSKIAFTKIKGKQLSQTGWTGNSKLCNAGTLPDTTINKITDRINYFRQNSGVKTPISVDPNKIIACLEAATMYAPIGVFSREPKPETHKCYSAAAADAAKYGQAVLESNPAQCITVLMNDEKSDEIYNRRLLTHPGLINYGFGCAENNSVFWLADKSFLTIDSAYYKNHFVCWPSAGACPVMLMFDKWSFSMLADFTDAVVTANSKKLGPVEFNTQVEQGNALGLPTLIIIPLGFIKWEAGDEINITISLKNKKSYSYSTALF